MSKFNLRIALALLLCALPFSPVRADDALVLKPGLTERGAKPTTWAVDVTADAKGAMAGVSSRLYGAFEPALSKPLVFTTNFPAARVFTFKVGAVSKLGAQLAVKLNGNALESIKWSENEAAQAAGTTYAVNLAAGVNTITLEIADRTGVVVMDEYRFNDSLNEVKDATPLNTATPTGEAAPVAQTSRVKNPDVPPTAAPDKSQPANGALATATSGQWKLTPGVTARSQKPETWTLDVSGQDEAAAKSVAAKLSSRLYGTKDGALHQPLVIKVDAQTPRMVGFSLSAVSKEGADLSVKLDGKEVWQKTWAAAADTHDSDKVLTLQLPTGAHEISFEVGTGVVVWDAIYIGGDAAQMPKTPEKIELAATSGDIAPPGVAQPTAINGAALQKSGAIATSTPTPSMNGYFPIWFALGQKSQYGDKYSGGLGTYTANHVPMAVYSAAADKTFFTYGGTLPGQRHLLNMVGYFDHKTGMVSKPVMVYDKNGVDDPHDNAALNIASDGTIWLFISGRGKKRPGFKYRSLKPYDISDWQQVEEKEMTYPQPWYDKDKGWMQLFTKYTAGRELYFETSKDGKIWSADQKLVGFGGHYQVSGLHEGKIGTFFNYHPGGDVDKRTNLYYAQTIDWGVT